ncbi:unnamed protein product [Rotaria sp. Silwood2]|nr:unnamed protein product [Rotaria sp. Silwood2]CAF2525692.1 unnamed protein product [Rotaria sp. Silwood2]CAF2743401.1 unnamed protein product [Rotaria sp. Silwood2]CAF2885920.1 unnamed protein product [Rotaria sp. Silwood2]CAF4033798.1 unnamed protein product [Rotaria sp. Silwood2]
MAKKQHGFGKRLSQFLSKMFWHLNQPVVPMYSFPNQKQSTPSSSKKSIKKVQPKSAYQISPIGGNHLHSHYASSHQTCSVRQRAVTLSSIQEE